MIHSICIHNAASHYTIMSVYIGRYIVYIFAVLRRASIIVSREQYSTYSLGYFWFFFFRRTQLLAELLYYFISIVFPFRKERKKRKLSFEMINFCCVHTSHHSRSWTIDAERRVWLVWWRISHKKRPLVLRQHAIVLLYIVLPSSAATIWWLIESVCFVIFDWVSWLSRSWVKNIYSCVYRLLNCWRTPILYVFLFFYLLLYLGRIFPSQI